MVLQEVIYGKPDLGLMVDKKRYPRILQPRAQGYTPVHSLAFTGRRNPT
jgi:hypothetical protein